MKFIQLLTTLTLLASASSVANAQPHRVSISKAQKGTSHPRGPDPDDRSCEQAERKAKHIVQRIFDGDCNNALDRDFTHRVNRIRDGKFPRNARNWRDRQYNNCGRDTIKTELDRIGKQCDNSHHAAKDCNELGKAAADNIVHEYGVCPMQGEMSTSPSPLQKFRHACRSVAYGKCEGYMTNAVRECGGDPLSLHKLSHLQNKCKDEVDSMTGYDDEADTEDSAAFINLPGDIDIDSLDTSEDQASYSKLRGAARPEANDLLRNEGVYLASDAYVAVEEESVEVTVSADFEASPECVNEDYPLSVFVTASDQRKVPAHSQKTFTVTNDPKTGMHFGIQMNDFYWRQWGPNPYSGQWADNVGLEVIITDPSTCDFQLNSRWHDDYLPNASLVFYVRLTSAVNGCHFSVTRQSDPSLFITKGCVGPCKSSSEEGCECIASGNTDDCLTEKQ